MEVPPCYGKRRPVARHGMDGRAGSGGNTGMRQMVSARVDDVRTDRVVPVVHPDSWDETTLPLKTPERWAFVLAVIGVLYAANEAENFVADQVWTLVAAPAIGYMLSRGLARAGTRYHA